MYTRHVTHLPLPPHLSTPHRSTPLPLPHAAGHALQARRAQPAALVAFGRAAAGARAARAGRGRCGWLRRRPAACRLGARGRGAGPGPGRPGRRGRQEVAAGAEGEAAGQGGRGEGVRAGPCAMLLPRPRPPAPAPGCSASPQDVARRVAQRTGEAGGGDVTYRTAFTHPTLVRPRAQPWLSVPGGLMR